MGLVEPFLMHFLREISHQKEVEYVVYPGYAEPVFTRTVVFLSGYENNLEN